MASNPDVRVHVPTINTAAVTELCIRTMRRRAGAPFELVVGDGGSTDGSLDVLRRFERDGWLTLEIAPGGRTHAAWLDKWFAECPTR
jgi:glycosyltransferase involved in cell wall biosynthesis